MGDIPQSVWDQLIEVETTAEDILADRQQIVELDRRRQQTRLASRAIYKEKEGSKQWVCFGNQFIKLSKKNTKKMLDNDSEEIENEMAKKRQELKPKLNRLRELENREDIKGFNLQPLSGEEIKSIKGLL